ncbi:MAG: adenylate/guanylate cyclase domain-containing protein, partial [Verrucomicrobiota bacterium]
MATDRENGKISIQVALTTVGVSLVLFTAIAIGVTSHLSAKRIVENLTDRIFSGTFREISFMAEAKLGLIDTILESNRSLVVRGFADRDDFVTLGEYYLNILQTYPYLSETGYGDREGRAIWAERAPGGVLSLHEVKRNDAGIATLVLTKLDESGQILSREEKETDYDPRERPWYQSAAEVEGLVWTEPYVFTSGFPGLSRTWRLADEDGSALGVFDVSFELDFLSEYLAERGSDRLGEMFILNLENGGEVIAHPDPSVAVDRSGEADRIPTVDSLGDPRLVEIYRIATEGETGAGVSGRVRERIEVAGVDFVLLMEPFAPGSDLDWIVAYLVPEEAIMGPVRRSNRIALLLGLAATLFGIGVALAFSKQISYRLSFLSSEIEDVGQLILSDREPKRSAIREVDVLESSVKVMKVGLRSFRRFVPAELVRSLLDRGVEAKLEGKRSELTIFFSDIIGYSAICEQLGPEELVEELGKYLEEMTEVIESRGGTVNQYVGDAIMAIFGAPEPLENHPLRCCEAALKFVERNEELARAAEEKGSPAFRSRIGINTGEVIVGNLGSPNRLYFTANGDEVNLASRLESINSVYGTRIVVGEATRSSVGDEMVFRLLDYVAVKGKKKGSAIYELVGRTGEVEAERRDFVERYEAGMTAYLSREWEEASGLFKACLESREDIASQLLIERCEVFHENPPGDDWDGVFEMKRKCGVEAWGWRPGGGDLGAEPSIRQIRREPLLGFLERHSFPT